MMSKSVFKIAAVVSIALATPVAADFKPIKSEADFLAIIGGKTLVDEHGGTYVVNGNGTMAGKTPKGVKLNGAWKWSGKFWCRNIVVGTKELGTNCQTWEVDGSAYRVTRDKGRGKTTVGQIK